jgi:hypothetical protein
VVLKHNSFLWWNSSRLIDEKRKGSAKVKSLEVALEKAQRVKSETETNG